VNKYKGRYIILGLTLDNEDGETVMILLRMKCIQKLFWVWVFY